MAHETASLVTNRDGPASGALSWYLAVALDATRTFRGGRRIALAGATEVSVGRGPAPAASLAGARLRVDLDDPFQSQEHFRLRLEDGGWRFEDAGSKNGTRLRGARARTEVVTDGDVIEAGATFLVVRRTFAPAPDCQVGAGEPLISRTLHAPLAADLDLLAQLAPTTLPVLIHGESGTGKEMAARAVHAWSGRRGPLVAVNCGAMPAGVAEAELFGVRRGAFSGAIEDRLGLVRSADGGTLFLDEVADLPAQAQAALLRVLQEGELRPLGTHKALQVDVRIVAATHRDLDALVAREAFRGDLAARLRGHVVVLPPLRARREDMGLIVADLLRRIDGGERPRRSLERAAARALFAHDWPGNVRELEHVLRSAVARAGDEIAIAHLPETLGAPTPTAPAAPSDERARILAALEACAGNQTRAARALGISRTTLVQRLRLHGIPRPRKRTN